MNLRLLNSILTKSTLIIPTLMAGLFLTVGCQPKTGSADEAQAQVYEANVGLQRMNDIELELRADGISIRYPQYSTYNISSKKESSLEGSKKKLEEYLREGKNTLRIADRSDVAFSDRAGLEERMANVNLLLAQINKRLGTPEAGAPDARFWVAFFDCKKTQTQDLTLFGIRILEYNTYVDKKTAVALSAEKRTEIAKRVRDYQQCAENLERGEKTLYGKTGPTKNTAKSTDEAAKLVQKQTENKNLADLLKDLAVD